MKDSKHVFLDSKVTLCPEHAVAAIIETSDGRYLLQHRDDKPEIFYPGHWGCFGGAVENNESYIETLRREMDEELMLDIDKYKVNYFTKFSFDFSFADIGIVERHYYHIDIQDQDIDEYVIREGKEFKLFSFEELFLNDYSLPYDDYALWMHSKRDRFSNVAV